MQGNALARSVSVLASRQIGLAVGDVLQDWSLTDEAAVRRTGARLVGNVRHAADLVRHAAPGLVRGIVLAPPLGPASAMGPLWHGHSFASPAMAASYRLSEPDITRGLERVIRDTKSERGTPRALSFLRTLAELDEAQELLIACASRRALRSPPSTQFASVGHPIAPTARPMGSQGVR